MASVKPPFPVKLKFQGRRNRCNKKYEHRTSNKIGPGLVCLQSLPFSRLADRLSAASRFQQRGEQKGVGGLGGNVLGGILGGDR